MGRLRRQRLQLPDSQRVGITRSGRRGRCGGQSWTRCQRRILSNSPRCRVLWAINLIRLRTCHKLTYAPYIATRLRCRRLGRTTSRALSGAFVMNFEEARGFSVKKMARLSGSSIHNYARRVFEGWKPNNEPDSERRWTAPEIASFYRAMTIRGVSAWECGADRTAHAERGRRHRARVDGQIQIRILRISTYLT